MIITRDDYLKNFEGGAKKMKKRKTHAFGKDLYLLGMDKTGVYYWLEQAKFDCGWYWGLGYVETYTNNKNPERAKDINSHQHFDSLFFSGPSHGFDNFKNFFTKTPLSDAEIWQLMEIMKSLYTAREFSDMIYRGGAHYTKNPCTDIIKNSEEYKRINESVIPSLLNKLYEILSED